ncbi:intracellular septation protein A [Pseudoalteromonas lipolytica SCSIO 04301]|jgi:intracellular septation protein|uniref:Inner membrane-spanning protein YciB n=1 Tax=Pseudoalteromonas lipolytica TaxID=570156 RepID=A0ABY1GB84_9GAMM|nr:MULTISPECIES: inner membrane-spanning protein YciB [Pseudoalteromonas]EWH07365.1 intracellular septation protein A [Pseudoalteromonas lipolytica SCSIO 04301]MBE0351179.1 intracellular septation protein [Pseudoalteromonas lipolytica LMEB 39]MCC9662550.1 septation protein IspZ [Pseudoalteromonas sp. MB41]QMW15718.1 septation protein IspZ [Pseudoalteromonas sp. MT33b]QPL44098.1 septation protein IspZ [Pseudoalteromonas sp. A41-2]
MHAIIEYIPLILFFAVFKLVDIYWATAVLMLTTLIQVAYCYFKEGKVPTRHWVFFAIAVVLGTLTLVFHDEQFVKWKATIVYAILSFTLLFSRYVLGKNLVKKALSSILENASESKQEVIVPDSLWNKLNLFWVAVTAGISALNIYIAYNFSLDFWVNFKVFGLMGITFVCVLATIILLFKYLPEDDENTDTKEL